MWPLVVLAAAIYCAVQGFRDFRRKHYLLAAVGAALSIAILTLPVQTHAVKVDLPMR